jgi:primosomal protein N' (replication factor Y)
VGTAPVARVLLDAPLPQLDRLLDYAIPSPLEGDVVPGVRVRVPLRTAGRVVDAYVVELGEAVDPDRPLSEIDEVVSAVRVLPRPLYELARRVSDRAAGSASDILRLAIPKRQVRVEKTWLAREDAAEPAAPSPEQIAWADQMLDGYPGLGDVLQGGERVALDAPPRPGTTSTGEQAAAWALLLAAAAARVLAGGRSAVLVVPDHRDLDQLDRALTPLIPPASLVRVDAARTGAERYRGFLRTLEPAPSVVFGNRSAVYAPVSRLGMLAVWDDGDPLLDEPLAPYVHARDAALVRQELEGGALVFAGHTRTTDVERLVSVGWVRDVGARRRESPRVVLSAAREGERPGVRVPSAAFAAAREALAHGPVLVQVARPGYSPVLVCGDCRQAARCVHCAGPLHTTARGRAPECRWCGRSATGWRCGHCQGDKLRLASAGSTRTADEFGRAFPGVRVIIADGDHPVLHVDARPALVIATRGAEPVAEGGYRAVVLLDGDRMLMADALRIGESCLRWWSNAAALAAPGAPVHLVGVAGQVARALATWNQSAYARSELASRAPLRMPPTARVAAVEGDADAVERALEQLHAEVELPEGAVVGPVAVDPPDRAGGRPATRPGPAARALVLFDYAHGADITASLRASVVQAALRTRRPARGGAPRNTLRVRVDVPDPEL